MTRQVRRAARVTVVETVEIESGHPFAAYERARETPNRASIAARANALADRANVRGFDYPRLTERSKMPVLRSWLERADSWSLQAGNVKTVDDAWASIEDELRGGDEDSEHPFAGYEGGAAEAPPTGDCIIVRDGEVERGPGCRPTDIELDSWKDVHKIMRKRFDGQGVESFYCLASSTQGQLVGEPILVAKGQTGGVRVDVDQVLVAFLALRSGGGVTFYAVHNHPGSSSHQPSDADRALTRSIKKGFDAALPAAKWGGHVVCGRDGCSLA